VRQAGAAGAALCRGDGTEGEAQKSGKDVLTSGKKTPAFLFAKREGAGPSRVLMENRQIAVCPERDLSRREPLPVPPPVGSGFRGGLFVLYFRWTPALQCVRRVCGDLPVCPSVHPSVYPSVRPSIPIHTRTHKSCCVSRHRCVRVSR